MSNTSLTALAKQELRNAKGSSSGRSSRTVHGGRECILHQTLIALVAGRKLGEHANPGEATVHVLQGRVRLSAGSVNWDGAAGHLIEVPDALHTLEALEDSVIVLTAVNRTS